MNGFSCIICAYNEGERIRSILDAAYGHPLLSEVIVVNDGSTDETAQVLAAYPNIRVISYPENRGKTYALGQGMAAARCDYLMLLDADLGGVGPRHIDALAEPVRLGRAQVSISLRSNSLGIYRALGLDFVSGERVISRSLFDDPAGEMARLPRWGAEAYMNSRIIEADLRVAVVDWPEVTNIRKHVKLGRIGGVLAELKMISDALSVLSPIGVVAQHYGLLRLAGRLDWLQAPQIWLESAKRSVRPL